MNMAYYLKYHISACGVRAYSTTGVNVLSWIQNIKERDFGRFSSSLSW